jgi:hypothetical protein
VLTSATIIDKICKIPIIGYAVSLANLSFEELVKLDVLNKIDYELLDKGCGEGIVNNLRYRLRDRSIFGINNASLRWNFFQELK